MTVQTKTDSDWFNLLSEENMSKPLWVLFGKEGQPKSVSALNLCQSYSNQHPDISFVHMNVNVCPSATNLSSVVQTPVHILFIAGVEYKRIWEESDITPSLIVSFKENFNECEIFSPEYFSCFGESITFSGARISVKSGQFTLVEDPPIDEFLWDGMNAQTIGGLFTIVETP